MNQSSTDFFKRNQSVERWANQPLGLWKVHRLELKSGSQHTPSRQKIRDQKPHASFRTTKTKGTLSRLDLLPWEGGEGVGYGLGRWCHGREGGDGLNGRLGTNKKYRRRQLGESIGATGPPPHGKTAPMWGWMDRVREASPNASVNVVAAAAAAAQIAGCGGGEEIRWRGC